MNQFEATNRTGGLKVVEPATGFLRSASTMDKCMRVTPESMKILKQARSAENQTQPQSQNYFT
jgi:hypothetical protein